MKITDVFFDLDRTLWDFDLNAEITLIELCKKNVKLNNLKRKKFDLITFQSSILTQNNFKIHKDIYSKDFIDTPEYFLDSKISFKTHYK